MLEKLKPIQTTAMTDRWPDQYEMMVKINEIIEAVYKLEKEQVNQFQYLNKLSREKLDVNPYERKERRKDMKRIFEAEYGSDLAESVKGWIRTLTMTEEGEVKIYKPTIVIDLTLFDQHGNEVKQNEA